MDIILRLISCMMKFKAYRTNIINQSEKFKIKCQKRKNKYQKKSVGYTPRPIFFLFIVISLLVRSFHREHERAPHILAMFFTFFEKSRRRAVPSAAGSVDAACHPVKSSGYAEITPQPATPSAGTSSCRRC